MVGHQNRLSRFWQELKRRRVIQVITVYASASFAIIEIINNLTEPLNLPTSLSTIVIIVLAVGFPLAIILSWLYDLTSGTFERTKPLDETEEEVKPVAVPNAWKIATYVSFVVIIGLVAFNIITRGNVIKRGSIQSLVILPFGNYTGVDSLDLRIQGMHSLLISKIGEITGLRVIGRYTSDLYKNTDKSIQQITKELNVGAAVELDVMCFGDTICFQPRLLSGGTEEKQLWVGNYSELKGNLFNVFNQIAKQIAGEVKISLTSNEEDKLAKSRTIDPDAIDAYLKGLYYFDQLSPETLALALEYFNRASEIEPKWALPYAGLAYYWVGIKQFGLAPNSITLPRIYENLEKAFKLDPISDMTLYVKALVSVWTEFNWDKGEQEFLQVLEINPNHAFARIMYGQLLVFLRKDSEALEQGEIAVRLDPFNPMIQGLYATLLGFTGEYNKGIEFAEKALAVAPDNGVALSGLKYCYFGKREYWKALDAWMKVYTPPLDEKSKSTILTICDEDGPLYAIVRFAEELENTGFSVPEEIGEAYIIAKNYSRGIDWLEKAYEIRDGNIPYVGLNLWQKEPFKIDDPRFYELVKKLNLPLPKSD